MATRVIDDSKLQDIAVAIQAKDNGGKMTVDEMPDRIDALPTGGTLIPKTITENGVYNATDDNADGYSSVDVNVPEKDPYEMLTAVMNKTATEIISDKIKELTTWSCAGNDNLQKVILSSNEFSVGSNVNGTRYVFYNCRSLKMLLFPHSKYGSGYGFGNYYASGCTNLAIVLIHAVGDTGGSSFLGCSQIKSFIITKTDSIQVLGNSNAFSKSGISAGTGYVYVPDSLKPDYQIATNWSVYSSQIRGYQDAPNYSKSNQYTVGDVCKHNNKFYAWISLTDGNSEPTNAVDTYTDWYCVADIEVI